MTRNGERQGERYRTDTEFRERKKRNNAKWAAANKDRVASTRAGLARANAAYLLDLNRACRENARLEAIRLLGGKCKCCGEAETGFLTIDHVNNDGYKERTPRAKGRSGDGGRKAITAIRAGERKRYQVLCYNCNCGRDKAPGKVCPHKRRKS